MLEENKRCKAQELEFKNSIFKLLELSYTRVNSLLEDLMPLLEQAGFEDEIPNVGITTNNKIVELQNYFEEHGISIYIKQINEDGKIDYIPSYVGLALINDLLKSTVLGVKQISGIACGYEDAQKSRKKMLSAQKKNGTVKKIMNLFSREKLNDDDAEAKNGEYRMISIPIKYYQDNNRKIFEFNIKDELVRCVSKFLTEQNQSIKKGGKINSRFSTEKIKESFDKYIAPDIEKLGLGEYIEEINNTVINIVKNDRKKTVKMKNIDYGNIEIGC